MKLWSIQRHLPSILRVSPRVWESVILGEFTINQSQLKRIFSAFKDKKKLIFQQWEFLFQGVPDFDKALKNTFIRTLGLIGWKARDTEGCKSKPEKLIDFMKSISQSDLKNTLEEVSFGFCGLQEDLVSQSFTQNTLNHIRFLGYFEKEDYSDDY